MSRSTSLNWDFLFKNITVGVVYQDETGAIIEVNKAAEQVLGLTANQMKGRSSVDPRWRAIKENGDPFPGEEHPAMVSLKTGEKLENVIMGVFHPKKKSWVWIQVNSLPEFENGSEKPTGVYTTFQNITEKRKADDDLMKSNAELLEKTKTLENLLHSQTNFIVKTDLSGIILFANEAYIEQFSHAHPDGVVGSSGLHSILAHHHERLINTIEKCIQNAGIVVQIELDKPGKDGITLTSLWDISVITDQNGKPFEVLCTGIDLTNYKQAQYELRISEEKYRSLVEESDNIIITVDQKGSIQYANLKTAQITGIPQSEFARGKFSIAQFYTDQQQIDDLKQDLGNLFENGTGYTKVTTLKIADRTIWVKGTATPIFGDHGQVIAAHVNAMDISELREKEQKLQLSEKKYRNLIEASDAIVTVIDEDGNYILVNKRGASYSKRRPEEYMGLSLWDTHEKENADRIYSRIKQVIDTKKGVITETMQPLEGKEYWFRTSFQPIDVSEGEKSTVMIMSTDITDRVIAEKQLVESEAQYRSLIESSDSIIAMFDLDGEAMFANDIAASLVGLSANKSLSTKFNLKDVFPTERKIRVEQDISTVIQTKKGINEEVFVELKGEPHYFKSSIQPVFDADNNVKAILLNATEITEQKIGEMKLIESEEQYRSLIESTDASVLEVDVYGNYRMTNERAAEVVGLSSKQMIGKHLTDFHSEEESGKMLEHIRKVAQSKKGNTMEVEVRIGGKPYWHRTSIQPIVRGGKHVESVLIMVTDISEQKKAEELLKASEDNYKNLFYESPQAYVIIQDGKFIECNRASEELMRTTREELIGIHPDEISPEFQPNGRRSAELAMEYIQKAVDEGKHKFEWIHIRKNGEEFLAEINLFSGQYNGLPSILVLWKDITDEKRNEQSVTRLSQIVNQSPVSIIMTDLHGNIQYVNKATVKNLGYSFDELKGQNPSIWKSEQTPVEEYERMWNTVLGGEKWKGEFLNTRKDGRIIRESSTIFPIFDSNGSITNLVAIQEDISERKKAESDLLLFQTVFDNAVNGRLITDLEGKIIYCNNFYADLHGDEKGNLIGKNCIEQISDVSLPQYQIVRRKLLQNFTIPSTELEHKRKDGTSYPALVNASLILDEKQEPKYISITVLDISDRKQIENEIIELNLRLEEKVKDRTKELQNAIGRLETFFEVSLDMLCVADQEGRFIKLSKAFEEVLHFDRSELEGRNSLELIHPDDVEITIAEMQKLQGQKRVMQFVNRYRTKEGDYRFIEWYSSPVGEYVYAVARDITERMERERELIAARKIAEEANISKSVFLSRMSHELRTPMNSILGFSQLLEMSELDEMQQNSLENIMSSGKHLLSLINEVLDIASIESGKTTFSIEQVNITQSIQSVCMLLSPFSSKNSIEIVLGEAFRNQLFIRADQQRIIQILTNLITNAIKYNQPGGKVFIDQWVVKSESGEKMIHVSIKDTGFGIKEEDLSRLFIPFERIGAQNTEIEGTGLGLAVVKDLTIVLGGKIGVSSVFGEGSEFWVEFPKCTIDDEQRSQEIAEIEIDNEKKHMEGTILYIEDNDMNISLVEDIFKMKRPSYSLITTKYGSAAVELVERHHPMLILLDLDLPDIHGSMVLKQLKENALTQSIPVIVVSADATKDQIRNLMAGGANEYLTKPFDIIEFLNIVDNYMDQTDA